MIFQEGLIHGVHLLSHVTEIFSNQFVFHQHGNGKMHVHHQHDFIEKVKSIIDFEERDSSTNHERNFHGQSQFKFHLLWEIHNIFDQVKLPSLHHIFIIQKITSLSLDVLIPPPKQ